MDMKISQSIREARASMRHAMMLELETRLLSEAGYYDAAGKPRTGAKTWTTRSPRPRSSSSL